MGAAISQALATLPTERQRAFLLHDHLGHTAPETARLTRALEATVRTRVHYARQRLREVLSGERLMSFA
jgi:DNA-directed RNA polymerase specialized sigma24 family protein